MKYVVIIIVLTGLPLPLQGAVFSVSTVPELESALTSAAGNGEDDTVNIAAGTYSLTSSLNYDSHEDKIISLQGSGDAVVIDAAGLNHRALFMRTYSSNADVTISGIVFINGFAQEGDNGAGVFVNISSADLVIENCQIRDCYAAAFYYSNDGGGAYIVAGLGADVTIRNCVIAGNGAKGHGGGLYLGLTDGTLLFVNNTVVNNNNKSSVVEYGGGIYLRLYYDTVTAQIYNNILWGNTYNNGGSNGDLYIENDGDSSGSPAAVFMYNNDYNQLDYHLSANLTLSDNISEDPLLSADYHLAAGSPCLDAGNAEAPGLAIQDFEGDPRSVDGNCDGDVLPDMGADEVIPSEACTPRSIIQTLLPLLLSD